MSIETALKYAISIIENYKLDLMNSKEMLGIDLVKKGFCQGDVYKEALKDIEKIKKEK